MPQVKVACRHTTIGLMPWAGKATIAEAYRRFAAQPGSLKNMMHTWGSLAANLIRQSSIWTRSIEDCDV
jgi:hypothetical protein